MARAKHSTYQQVGLKYGFRSGLEVQISQQLKSVGIDPKYETLKLPYRVEKSCTYTPDFPVSNKIIIETKGRFQTADRMKMLMIQKQYPDIEFRFIFDNSNSRISKASKTTYARWCEKNGFKYADKTVPIEWIEEIKKLNRTERKNK
jgi:hypothetical protein